MSRTNRISAFVAVVAAFGASMVSSHAQSGTATVAAGKEVRLSSHEVFNKACTPGGLVEIKPTTQPRHGTIAIRTASVKTSAGSPCPNKDWPTRAVFFEARAGYTGSDTVTYQIKSPAGKVSSHTVAITITP